MINLFYTEKITILDNLRNEFDLENIHLEKRNISEIDFSKSLQVIVLNGFEFKEALKNCPKVNSCIIVIGKVSRENSKFVHSVISALDNLSQIKLAIRNASIHLHNEIKLQDYNNRLRELYKIGVALSSERRIGNLLKLILDKSKEITYADAGSLYIVEKTDKENILHFKLAQTDSLKDRQTFQEMKIPCDTKSISGFVATTGKTLIIDDVYKLPEDSEFQFNDSFDKEKKYRSKSMIAVPMRTREGEIIGVIQLINRKRNYKTVLKNAKIIEQEVISFNKTDEELLSSLAAQAAVSLENNELYKNIKNLFEGFVTASVTAIEARDPTTSGHSERVAIFTVGLAEIVDSINVGSFKKTKFSVEQIQELRYASLLHDFGKVGVRENVLVKPKKLYTEQSKDIWHRFHYVKKLIESEFDKKKLNFLLNHGREKYLENVGYFEEQFQKETALLENYMEVIFEANEPKITEEDAPQRLMEISKFRFTGYETYPQPLLRDEEVVILSIRKGSLTPEDRADIESHVQHTYEFLKRIPWTENLKNVPQIAYLHHEKLNGTGYPLRKGEKEIPIQSQMMTVSDIYDALTATDRPYKKSVNYERALDILSLEAQNGHINRKILDIFIEAEIYKKTLNSKK
ncbi:MAG: GAF domain-containing protein [Calditrichaeota bacterium]|nr:MAG: GAF domain-containing protein [Calditrichota bacterium]